MPGIVAIMGMPGSGKSTLGKRLVQKFDADLISAGDLARRLAEKDEETRIALEKGEMAPKEKMNREMRDILAAAILSGKSLILEGYPRYREQLADLLNLGEDENLAFIWIGCNDEVAYKRLNARGRDDDTREAINRRILNFWSETYPIYADIADRTHFIAIGDQDYTLNNATTFLNERRILALR